MSPCLSLDNFHYILFVLLNKWRKIDQAIQTILCVHIDSLIYVLEFFN